MPKDHYVTETYLTKREDRVTSNDGMTPAEREKVRLGRRSLKVAQTSPVVAALALFGSISFPIFTYYSLQNEIRISQLKQRAFSVSGYITEDACLKKDGEKVAATVYTTKLRNAGDIPIKGVVVTLQPSEQTPAKVIDRQAIHADPPTRLKIEDAGAGSLLVIYEDPLPPRSTYSLIVAKTPYQAPVLSPGGIIDDPNDDPPEAWAESEVSNSRVAWAHAWSLDDPQPCPQ
jgi:hypothetical protein